MLDITSPLEMALAYARHGWAVLPLHSLVDSRCDCRRTCASPAKHPRTLHGVKDATTDLDKIARWWGMWPQAGVGIATGAVSGIVVFDVDPRHGGLETIDKVRKKYPLFLPETARVRTQGMDGGYHLYYAYREGMKLRSPGPGIDIKSDGGYVVAPPSVGPEGPYRWEVAMELTQL